MKTLVTVTRAGQCRSSYTGGPAKAGVKMPSAVGGAQSRFSIDEQQKDRHVVVNHMSVTDKHHAYNKHDADLHADTRHTHIPLNKTFRQVVVYIAG